MIQITAQMRVLVAIEPVGGRKGIDSLARLCQEKLANSRAEWMPWNYRETLERIVSLSESAWSYDESHKAGNNRLRPDSVTPKNGGKTGHAHGKMQRVFGQAREPAKWFARACMLACPPMTSKLSMENRALRNYGAGEIGSSRGRSKKSDRVLPSGRCERN